MDYCLSRAGAALTITLMVVPAIAGADSAAEQADVLAWRQNRSSSLTSDSGWLTLAGLFWLKDGDNSFGSDPGNELVLNNASLAGKAGTFTVSGSQVSFTAAAAAGILLNGQPLGATGPVKLASDARGEPTELASGALRFFVIERSGKLGVRVRDLKNPRRLQFRGLEYFPISNKWALSARFVPYQPARPIRIINILGMEEDDVSPGAVVFSKNGREWRLDTVLESPGDETLFIMFADATSGHETYGAGRFLTIPMPVGGVALLDFNKAYNPPCALNDFATCPLPPPQNRLQLRVDAGELKYSGGPEHSF
jgi:uncharacterized protein (DUF1684 family)